MKNISKIFFMIMVFVIFTSNVYAECNNQELNDYAESVKVVYERLKMSFDSEGNPVNNNGTDASYLLHIYPEGHDLKVLVSTSTGDENLNVSYDSKYKSYAIGSYNHFEEKSYIIDIYSADNSKICPGEKLRTIEYTVPPYNINSQSSYCASNPDAEICNKFKNTTTSSLGEGGSTGETGTSGNGSELNIDKDGDGKADINIDTDGDGYCDLNCDSNNDGKPDINVDKNGDKKPDYNIDTNNDYICDLNCDYNSDGIYEVNIDTNDDGKCEVNCDTNNDYMPDINIDYRDNLKPYFNIDEDGDGEPDKNLINIDSDGDGECDKNCDTNGDGWPDENISFWIIILYIILEYCWYVIIPVVIISIIYFIKIKRFRKKEDAE